jgi:hypothetical protein
VCQILCKTIPNKFPWILGIFFSVLWYFCMIKFDKKIGILILVTCLLFLLIFVKSCYVLTMILCYVILILDMWPCDVFISGYVLIFPVLCVQLWVSCLASNERFLVKIKCKICLKCAIKLGMTFLHNSCVRTELKYFVKWSWCENYRSCVCLVIVVNFWAYFTTCFAKSFATLLMPSYSPISLSLYALYY